MKLLYVLFGVAVLASGILLAGCDSCGCGGRSKDSGIMTTPQEYELPDTIPDELTNDEDEE